VREAATMLIDLISVGTNRTLEMKVEDEPRTPNPLTLTTHIFPLFNGEKQSN